MTTIIIRKSNNQFYKSFTCMGHAGYADSGKDIVCAAVSVLVINTIHSLEVLAKEDIKVDADENTGFIQCIFVREPNTKSILLMDSLVLGLKEIKKQYGKKFLELKFEEV